MKNNTTAKLTSLKITEILTARICHDLINSIGPANNGLDLLKNHLVSHERYEIETCINNSVQRTLHRLVMIRSALSYSTLIIGDTATSYQKTLDQFLDNDLIHKACEGIESYFLKNDLDDAKPRALLILLLCIQDCFSSESEVRINFFNDKIGLIIQAKHLIIHHEIIKCFSNLIQAPAVTPQTIFCYMLQRFLIDRKIELKLIDFQPQILHIQLTDN